METSQNISLNLGEIECVIRSLDKLIHEVESDTEAKLIELIVQKLVLIKGNNSSPYSIEEMQKLYQKGIEEMQKYTSYKKPDEQPRINLPLTSSEAAELYALLEKKMMYREVKDRLWDLLDENEAKLADKIYRAWFGNKRAI